MNDVIIKVDENSAQTAVDAAAASQAAFAALLATSFGVAKPSDIPSQIGFGYWLSVTPGKYVNHGGVDVNPNSLALILRNAVGDYSVTQSALDLSAVVGPPGPASTVPGPQGPQGSSLKVPSFVNQAYPIDSQVNHLGKDWVANAATVAGDVPGTSSKWVERLGGYLSKSDLAVLGVLAEGFTTTDQIKPTPFTKFTGSATLDSRTKNAWYIGKSTKKVNEIYVPITSNYNGSLALTDSVYVRIGINGVFTFTTEITLAQMTAQGINTQSGVEATTMYKITVPEFTINNTDVIYVGMMCKSATDKLGFVTTNVLANEWVNGYNSTGSSDINALSVPPTPSGTTYAYNIYFKLSEKVYSSNIPAVSQSSGTSMTATMSQKAITTEINILDSKATTNANTLIGKGDRKYQTLSTFNNSSDVSSTYPFWMNANNVAAWKYVQFSIKAKAKMTLKSIDFAGAYITTALTLGTGNVSLRVYKGVAINGSYVADFTNAILLRKTSISIMDFYANSTKAATADELKTKLLAGEISHTTFNFTHLDVAKDEVLHFFFGADDDTYYQNTPNTAMPTMRISLVQSSNLLMANTLFVKDTASTFFSTGQFLLASGDAFPSVKISAFKEVSSWNNGSIKIDSRNIYTFIGAMNTILDALFSAKPTARVLIISHNTLSGVVPQSGEHFKLLVEAQQKLADYWGANYLPLWQKLNWKNNGSVNTFKTWCPDEIHPYSNLTKVTTSLGQMSIADFIIHDFVKDVLKPIFGDNWAGKKVATYGTSIPYGGKYTMLAANELGGVGFNYCSSGSYLRRGKTDNIPVTNSFTNTADVTYRNYQKDMLALIGTANEPDLFVFDFGINDFNLDNSDFDITF